MKKKIREIVKSKRTAGKVLILLSLILILAMLTIFLMLSQEFSDSARITLCSATGAAILLAGTAIFLILIPVSKSSQNKNSEEIKNTFWFFKDFGYAAANAGYDKKAKVVYQIFTNPESFDAKIYKTAEKTFFICFKIGSVWVSMADAEKYLCSEITEEARKIMTLKEHIEFVLDDLKDRKNFIESTVI
ncbi:hypothetical protein [Treponema zioleckii]|uniref:hypothetical protein n=1 Tax=Treponema zioleckii TaxID=331680 RepID=UPI00168BAC1A|nr:hypothetical protein [Treponema zioleckii]